MNTTCHCCNTGFRTVSFYLSRLNSVFSVWWKRLFYLKLCLALDLPLDLGSISHILKISKLTLVHFPFQNTLHFESLKALPLIRCIAHIPLRLFLSLPLGCRVFSIAPYSSTSSSLSLFLSRCVAVSGITWRYSSPLLLDGSARAE